LEEKRANKHHTNTKKLTQQQIFPESTNLCATNNTNNNNSIPITSIQIGDTQTQCLLDTGASFSFINKQYTRLHNVRVKRSKITKVEIGNATKVDICGSCSLTFRLNNSQYNWNFLVLDNLSFDIILGADFLNHACLVIDVHNQCFYNANDNSRTFPFKGNPILYALHEIDEEKQTSLNKLLHDYQNTMSTEIGKTNYVKCRLKVEGKPVAQKPYFVTPKKRKLIQNHVREMLRLGVIRPSDSPWASPVAMQKEGDGYRFCLDYRMVNKMTQSDPFPIPRIESVMGRLQGAKYISKLDLRKGYWQIAMEPSSIPYTAFVCDEGKFEFVRMPFGLKTAPSIFQRFVNRVLGKARGTFAEAYLDDILIYSSSWEEHLEHIAYVLNALQQAGLTVNISKCSFCKSKMEYLGYIISSRGVEVNQEKLRPMKEFPTPKTQRDVKQFLGLCGWYRQYIENFSTLVEPLNRILKKSMKFSWGVEQQNAFCRIKDCICNATALALPDFDKQFILRTDASDVGLGAVLAQKDEDGNERPIAFASRTLSTTERHYHATEKECLGIIWALKKFEAYLDGQPFQLQTDNRALLWLDKMKDVNSKFMRWSLRIQDFDPTITHCPGKLNVVADALSRAPTGNPEEEDRKSVMDPPSATLSFLSDLTSTITLESLHTAQQNDDECKAILHELPKGFIVENNVLCKIDNRGNKLLYYIPLSLRSAVLEYFHDAPHSGHLGIRKTLGRLTKRFYWIKMHEDIFNYVRSCTKCQSTKNPSEKPSGSLQPVRKNGPWDMLTMDLMGPLPLTAKRNTQLLVVVDHFSKWVELFPLTNGTANKIASIIEREIFCRFGAPKSILTDNGTNFRSKCLHQLCKAWGIKQKFTSPYHPQANLTERINRTLRGCLSTYIADKQKKWDEYLPAVALALRTAVSDTTGYSPSMLVFGREILTPLDRNLEISSEDFSSRIAFQTDLISKLGHIYSKVRQNIEKAHVSQTKYYNRTHKHVKFAIDDKVMLRTHYLSEKAKRFMKKFAYRWTGPFRVSRKIGAVTYELSDLETGEVKGTHNVKNLKAYFDRPSNE